MLGNQGHVNFNMTYNITRGISGNDNQSLTNGTKRRESVREKHKRERESMIKGKTIIEKEYKDRNNLEA